MELKKIISGCQKANAKAQKALVLRYAGLLLTVSRRYMKNEVDAEDVLQDSFIKIFQAFNQFDPNKGSLDGWMKRIVINTALKQYRAQKQQFPTDNLEHNNEVFILPSVYEKLHEEDLIQLISSIPEGYRQVFNLYALEGYSHKEIAEMLGIAEASSRSSLSRARMHIQKRIKKNKISESWMKIG